MKIDPNSSANLSAQIAKAIRDSIVAGDLIIDQRLPSEAELADYFQVSRPTVREALKRLAAKSLIRTQRGATGGAFVNRISFEEAYSDHVTTSTLLLSMNAVSFDTACEARYALERACAPLSALRRTPDQLATMRAEILRQSRPSLTDESFCESDVAFHRALVDGADNPVLSYQLAGSIEAMQPLMNIITFSARSREKIISLHSQITDAIETRDGTAATLGLNDLEAETRGLAASVFAARSAAKHPLQPAVAPDPRAGSKHLRSLL
ncbi:FadR/GntR family transcriptional regulator [Parasedimentitalea psychrophila]|uniref:FadR/GntR family transcriptional regulator n=1 Tax=Parasedimentitalea psychrophila TaxID=2997337 RepID=A0A9Y2P567_9RHOB|nr:FadR/GntR family transcriptional regulator [Parasedimentitalea psychrophila]WIY27632.1 FadR/GntR family transcriptional regulator [Parasedimentitalea psychrophila]